MLRTPDRWIKEYEKMGALWIHDGNPKRPHALLTSGNHSSGFFNSELVMEDPSLLDEASHDLVRLLMKSGLNLSKVNRVVGPAMGAITLAHSVAASINYEKLDTEHHLPKASPHCLRAYTEKETDGLSKLMVMAFKKTTIRAGEKILPVEDVLTTGGSVYLTVTAVTNAGGTVLPFLAVLVNRSGLTQVSGKEIVALIDRPMSIWTGDECPLCMGGSEAIRPKGTDNWSRLNATY